MRRFGRAIECRPNQAGQGGFTLLELVLALFCSAVVVGLITTVWIQVIRTGQEASLESAASLRQESDRRILREWLEGLLWSSTSNLESGAMTWRSGTNALEGWGRRGKGRSPGPYRWYLAQEPTHGWRIEWREVQDGLRTEASTAQVLPEISHLSLDLLQGKLDQQGEQVRWVTLEQWERDRPFQPMGFRLRVRWHRKQTDEDILRML